MQFLHHNNWFVVDWRREDSDVMASGARCGARAKPEDDMLKMEARWREWKEIGRQGGEAGSPVSANNGGSWVK